MLVSPPLEPEDPPMLSVAHAPRESKSTALALNCMFCGASLIPLLCFFHTGSCFSGNVSSPAKITCVECYKTFCNMSHFHLGIQER